MDLTVFHQIQTNIAETIERVMVLVSAILPLAFQQHVDKIRSRYQPWVFLSKVILLISVLLYFGISVSYLNEFMWFHVWVSFCRTGKILELCLIF